MTTDDIEILINKNSLTQSEKKSIKDEADRLGIAYNIRQGCRDCYDKLLLKIYDKVRSVTSSVSIDGYRFKMPGDSFRTYCGEIFNEATLPEKVVGRLHKSIIDDRFIKVDPIPENDADKDIELEHDGTLGEILG